MAKYKETYHEYTDTTDEGADKRIMSPESLQVVAKGKEIYAKGAELGDQAMMDEGHAMAEGERAKYGYSGGANGGAYNPLSQDGDKGVHVSETHMTSPTWTSPYKAQRDTAVAKIQEQKPFSYDPESDPVYQAYKEQYTRQGAKAAKDTLATTLARTGGNWNSNASIAAQQANEAYMSALADKVPELYQLAYQMWADEGDRLRADAQMYDSLDSADAARWQGTVLSPFQADRAFGLDYDQYLAARKDADWEKQYQERAYEDQRGDVDFERRKEAAEKKSTISGDFSGYKDLYGFSDEEIAALEAIWKKETDAADRERAINEAIQRFQAAGDASGMAGLGWDTQEALRRLALETQGMELDNQLTQAQIVAANRSNRGGTTSTKKPGTSIAYDDALKTARGFDTEAEAERYLNSMVDGGLLTEDEAGYIYSVLGYGMEEEEEEEAGSGQVFPKIYTPYRGTTRDIEALKKRASGK